MSDPIRDFKDLIVWQRAIEYAKEVYILARKFPRQEQFGLTSQLQRAAVSVSSNIAEGHARQGKEFACYVSIARGSLAESESQLLLAIELGYIPKEEMDTAFGLALEIRKMLSALSRKLTPA